MSIVEWKKIKASLIVFLLSQSAIILFGALAFYFSTKNALANNELEHKAIIKQIEDNRVERKETLNEIKSDIKDVKKDIKDLSNKM